MEEEEPVADGSSSQVSELEKTVAALNREIQSLKKEIQESREMEIVGVVNQAESSAAEVRTFIIKHIAGKSPAMCD